MNWNARKLAIAAIVVLSLTTATSTLLLAVMLWKQSRPVAATVPAPPPSDPELTFSRNGPGDLNLRPGKDGTLHVRTEAGDFIVTNGVNHIVTTDDQGNTKEITIVTDENGSNTRRVSARAFRRARGGAGAGGGLGAGGGEGGGIGGEVRVEEDVLAPPTPATP